jgi:hypothetical protein
LRLCQSAADPRLIAISSGTVAGAMDVEYGVCAITQDAATKVRTNFMRIAASLEIKLHSWAMKSTWRATLERAEEFQVWKLTVRPDKTAALTCDIVFQRI